MRDLEQNPYSPDEERVAKWWFEKGVGGGDDPIGAALASHDMAVHQRNKLKAEVNALRRQLDLAQRTINALGPKT